MYDWIKDFFESNIDNLYKVIGFGILGIALIIFLSIKGKKLYDNYFNCCELRNKIQDYKDDVASLNIEIDSLNDEIKSLQKQITILSEKSTTLHNENKNLKILLQSNEDDFINRNQPYGASDYEAIKEFINVS